jgi:feruloyl esterase
MIRRVIRMVLISCVLVCSAALAPARAAQPCSGLANVALANNTTITLATDVAAGQFTPPDGAAVNLPAFCRVSGVSRPTTDSEIKFEVWLPAAWNGKFDQGGNGGYGRGFNVPGGFMIGALKRGYAVAGTDMGHPRTFGYDATWAFGHPEKLKDWAYRANHVTAQNSKALIRAFYGEGPRFSYFTGCSDGGHEALMEAQRFPDDFDGIVGGALANNWTRQSAGHIWQARALLDAAMTASKLALVGKAAVAACDGVDGLSDGLIEDPRRCRFDPVVLQCKGADALDCLTAAQVDAVRKNYAGLRNPRTGQLLYPGVERGGEALWTFVLPPTPGGIGLPFYRYLVFENPSWDMNTLDFDHDVAFGDAKMGPIVNSTDPDLRDFRALGGKFIMYHGWSDQAINPRNSIAYLNGVARFFARHDGRQGRGKEVGQAKHKVDSFIRLFMIPSMPHCSGGPGVNTFDALTALEQWVEHGIAPDMITASNAGLGLGANVMSAATGTLTRPLCAYPRVASWTGRGSTTEAANFRCVMPRNSDGDDDDREDDQD